MAAARLLALVPALIALLPAAPADADEEVVAVPFNRYASTTVTVDQGELLTFRNTDGAPHDVTARAAGPDGRPLFASATIGNGRSAEVEGARYLGTGSYRFFCSVHPTLMQGVLEVGAAGSPLPRPTAPEPDTRGPALGVSIRRTTLARVERSGRLTVGVSLGEAASLTLRASTRIGDRRVSLVRRGGVRLQAGKRHVALRLGRRAQRRLSAMRRALVTVEVRALDPAGNATTARARRTLR